MDEFWNLKGLSRHSSQPSPLSASLNQFEISSGQFGHPYVSQEVCVIERTIRQDPLGANVLNFGLQHNSTIKSVRGDVNNSLLALIPGSQQQLRTSYQPIVNSRPPYAPSNTPPYHMNSVSTPGMGNWTGHISALASGSRGSNGGSGTIGDTSSNMIGREANLSMLGREVNMSQFSRMGAGKDCFDSGVLRTSGMEVMKQNIVSDNSTDGIGQGPYPQWMSEVVTKRNRLQTTPVLNSGDGYMRASEVSRDIEGSYSRTGGSSHGVGGSYPRTADASRDVGGVYIRTSVEGPPDVGGSFSRTADASRDAGLNFSGNVEPSRDMGTGMCNMSHASSSTRGARVYCINYDTGQRVGGELCLSNSGRLGVRCACHNSHMSVAKFTQHAGVFNANPGNVVVMEGGECLVQWRKGFFARFGVTKAPEDNMGWDWNEVEGNEPGPSKYKGVVTQSWQKEVDVSYGDHVRKSRLTQMWDSSASPGSSGKIPPSQNSMALPPNSGQGTLETSREALLKSFGRTFRSNPMEFASDQSSVGSLQDSAGRNQASARLQCFRNPSPLGISPTGEFFNFISHGTHQYVSAVERQVAVDRQVAVERQVALNSRSLLKGIDTAWNDGREPGQQEKDSSLSSFELRLGQPSQQAQPAGASYTSPLGHMQGSPFNRQLFDNLVLKVMEGQRQKDMQNNSTSGSSLGSFRGQLNHHQQDFGRANFVDSARLEAARVDANRGLEGNGSLLFDHPPFKKMEDLSYSRFSEELRERERLLGRDGAPLTTEGLNRWPSCGPGGNSLKSGERPLFSSDHTSKLWENDVPRQVVGPSMDNRATSQGRLDLDPFPNQEWTSKCRHSRLEVNEALKEIEVSRDVKTYGAEILTHSQGDCLPSSKEICAENKEQLPFGNMETFKATKEGSRCPSCNCEKSACSKSRARGTPKPPEQVDLCLKEAEEETQIAGYRQRISRDATSRDCGSPKVRRLRSFEALTSNGCSCGGSSVDEHPTQTSALAALAGSSPALGSVGENETCGVKGSTHPEKVGTKPELRESTEGFQWKDMTNIFVSGDENIVDAAADDLLPPTARLEEDLLADTAAKRSSAAVRSGVSPEQQPVSDVCSKSSEIAVSAFSDGVGGGGDEDSHAQSADKHPGSEVVDEGSGIGKSCSSDGVEMELAPKTTLSKLHDTQKHESPSSPGDPSCSNAEHVPTSEIITKARGGQTMEEQSAMRSEEYMHVESGKVEKKRRQPLKRKWVQQLNAVDTERQDTSGIARDEEPEFSQTPVQSAEFAKRLTNRNGALDPSPISVAKLSSNGRKVVATHGDRAIVVAESGKESNGEMSLEALTSDANMEKRGETLIIRVPQALNRKKAKRTGRSKIDMKTFGGLVTGLRNNLKKSPELVTVEASTVDNSSFRGSVITGSFAPESAAVFDMSPVQQMPTPNVRPVRLGRVVLGCPSPRSATRTASLNDIMRMPEVQTRTRKFWTAAALFDGLQESVVEDGARRVDNLGASKESEEGDLMGPMDGQKASFKDKQKSLALQNGRKISSTKAESTITNPKECQKGLKSKHALGVSAGTKEGVKENSLKDLPPNGSSRDGILKDAHKVCTLGESQIVTSTPLPRQTSVEEALKKAVKAVPAHASTPLSALKVIQKLPLGRSASKATAIRSVTNASASTAMPHTNYKDTSKEIAVEETAYTEDEILVSAPVSRSRVFLKARAEGKALRKAESTSPAITMTPDNRIKEVSFPVKSLKETMKVLKSSKPEGPKIRSLYELTAEKKLPGSGGGVYEFHDEAMEGSGFFKEDSSGRISLETQGTFSVPVHVSESKSLIIRGERSPRTKFANKKSLFQQSKVEGVLGGSRLSGQVEIVVGSSIAEITDAKIASSKETETTTGPVSRPLITRLKIPRKPLHFVANSAVTSPGPEPSSSLAQADEPKEVVETKITEEPVAESRKRIVEQFGALRSNIATKKRKVFQDFRPVGRGSGVLKIRAPVHMSTATVMPPSSHVVESSSNAEEEIMKSQVAQDDFKSPGRKKRCKRLRRPDSRLGIDLGKCQVCGSSTSELINKLVSCGRCPVKVHQGCYGVKKIPSGSWVCRTCKASPTNPICVLCGYGSGAMTRAQKAKGFMKALVKAWQETPDIKKDRKETCSSTSQKSSRNGLASVFCDAKQHTSFQKYQVTERSYSKPKFEGETEIRESFEGKSIMVIHPGGDEQPHTTSDSGWIVSNTIAAGMVDPNITQWVHMVCALWMPGTRCLNIGTMGVFDVSGVTQTRRKMLCSICKRKGGSCIKCRVDKCNTYFHPWCAHGKGLLQSEIVGDGSDQVGFFGKCLVHGDNGTLKIPEATVVSREPEVPLPSDENDSKCARTEGYRGKLTPEERALCRRQAHGQTMVPDEQFNAWLAIVQRKTAKSRRFLKPANSELKTDHREYLRFKQEQGWRRLVVYKSGIHALGLYTAELICKDEMVVEYIGEIVGLRVADKREADYHSGKLLISHQGACYLFRIDKERIIDATRKGGIARFVNHSCSPNCVAKVICVKNQNKVVFFAQRDICPGEEITYDYQFNFEQEGDKIPCFCGSDNCRGTLN